MNKIPKCSSEEHRATFTTLIGISCGIIIGILLKNFTNQPWSERAIMYYQLPGEIFLRIINCLILPLIISSVVSASCHLSKSGSIGVKALYYYITTTTLGIILCVILVQTIKPGEYHINRNLTIISLQKFVTTDTFLDLLRNFIPDNFVKACLNQYQTVLSKPINSTAEENVHLWRISHQYIDGTNVLGLVGISLLFGIAIGCMDKKGKPLLNFFQALSDLTAIIMNWTIMAVPFGVLFLIPGKILQTNDLTEMIFQLGIYVSTVILGLLIHGLIVLPSLYFISTRQSPFRLLSKIGPAIITALGTSSSTATVPTTIKCLDSIGINPKVSRFVAPIGATINMDGIALYETVGALFIIQQRGLDYSLIRIVAIALVAHLIII
ncbi:hypothetical protein PV327_004891 [Microctonus hyperodae]|uniref:Amino acid transporter n=1 Tax=Microctonus hyperodae TaxID=165561 RepID=A0AA39KN80_MICHY|nr:hypothetical protein PV327_004891 [Microctonus hyperodae]